MWNYSIAFAAEIVLTFAAYELIRRIPVLRYFVLGLKKETMAGKGKKK